MARLTAMHDFVECSAKHYHPDGMKAISAADANRHFSAVLRDVAQGDAVVITSRGKPVATMAPVTASSRRTVARANLLARLRTQAVAEKAAWKRDWKREDLYAE